MTLVPLVGTYGQQIKDREWLNFAICVFIGAVFLIGPIFANWMDKKYCPYHEMALMSCSLCGILQGYCTWVICFVAFVPAVAAVFQIIEDGISASGVTVIGCLLAIAVMLVYYWITPASAPNVSDVWNAKMEIKYARKIKKQSRTKYLWAEKAELAKATFKYVVCLKMLHPQYAYTFATCGLFHLCFDLVIITARVCTFTSLPTSLTKLRFALFAFLLLSPRSWFFVVRRGS